MTCDRIIQNTSPDKPKTETEMAKSTAQRLHSGKHRKESGQTI